MPNDKDGSLLVDGVTSNYKDGHGWADKFILPVTRLYSTSAAGLPSR